MQWLAQYPSCPGDCMIRWQYLAKQSRLRWVPLSWACFNADAAAAVWTWFGNVGCSSERWEKGATCRMDSIDGYADQWTCKYKCVNGITMLHKLSEHCAYAHMRIWAYTLRWRRTYQALPSGEMDGEGCRMKERTMTVKTKPLLARIFGWWAMFLLFFPNWVLLWWLAVLWASYEFAWLAASKERNKIGILNLFLLVSWTTMSDYYFPSAVLVYDDDFGVWRLWCVSWLPNESFAEGEEYEYELASEPLLAPDHFYDRWSSPVMDFPSVVLY